MFAKFWNYGIYSSDNYGVHSMAFLDAYGNKFYYSYKTLIAFYHAKTGEFHIIKNYWGTTTGKHLNWINSNKKIREDEKTFNKNYKRLFN